MCRQGNMDIPVRVSLFLVLVGFLNYACGQDLSGVPITLGDVPIGTSGGPGSDVMSGVGQSGMSMSVSTFGSETADTAAAIDNTMSSVALGSRFQGQPGDNPSSSPDAVSVIGVQSLRSDLINAPPPPIPMPGSSPDVVVVSPQAGTADPSSTSSGQPVDISAAGQSGVAVSLGQLGQTSGAEPAATPAGAGISFMEAVAVANILDAAPENLNVVTENLGTVAENLGAVTENLGAVTENLGAVTEHFGSVTENLGTAPENLGSVTENLGAVTENLGEVTENLGTAPENLGSVIENIDVSPENFGAAPDNLDVSPENIATAIVIADAMGPDMLQPADPAIGSVMTETGKAEAGATASLSETSFSSQGLGMLVVDTSGMLVAGGVSDVIPGTTIDTQGQGGTTDAGQAVNFADVVPIDAAAVNTGTQSGIASVDTWSAFAVDQTNPSASQGQGISIVPSSMAPGIDKMTTASTAEPGGVSVDAFGNVGLLETGTSGVAFVDIGSASTASTGGQWRSSTTAYTEAVAMDAGFSSSAIDQLGLGADQAGNANEAAMFDTGMVTGGTIWEAAGANVLDLSGIIANSVDQNVVGPQNGVSVDSTGVAGVPLSIDQTEVAGGPSDGGIVVVDQSGFVGGSSDGVVIDQTVGVSGPSDEVVFVDQSSRGVVVGPSNGVFIDQTGVAGGPSDRVFAIDQAGVVSGPTTGVVIDQTGVAGGPSDGRFAIDQTGVVSSPSDGVFIDQTGVAGGPSDRFLAIDQTGVFSGPSGGVFIDQTGVAGGPSDGVFAIDQTGVVSGPSDGVVIDQTGVSGGPSDIFFAIDQTGVFSGPSDGVFIDQTGVAGGPSDGVFIDQKGVAGGPSDGVFAIDQTGVVSGPSDGVVIDQTGVAGGPSDRFFAIDQTGVFSGPSDGVFIDQTGVAGGPSDGVFAIDQTGVVSGPSDGVVIDQTGVAGGPSDRSFAIDQTGVFSGPSDGVVIDQTGVAGGPSDGVVIDQTGVAGDATGIFFDQTAAGIVGSSGVGGPVDQTGLTGLPVDQSGFSGVLRDPTADTGIVGDQTGIAFGSMGQSREMGGSVSISGNAVRMQDGSGFTTGVATTSSTGVALGTSSAVAFGVEGAGDTLPARLSDGNVRGTTASSAGAFVDGTVRNVQEPSRMYVVSDNNATIAGGRGQQDPSNIQGVGVSVSTKGFSSNTGSSTTVSTAEGISSSVQSVEFVPGGSDGSLMLNSQGGPVVSNVAVGPNVVNIVSVGGAGASGQMAATETGAAVDMSVNFPEHMAVSSDFQRNFDWSEMKLRGSPETPYSSVNTDAPQNSPQGPIVNLGGSLNSGSAGIAVDMSNNIPPPFELQTGGPQGQEGSQGFQTGVQGFQTGSKGFQTESQGFPSGSQGFQTGSQGVQTGTQDVQTGSQGFQTGPQGFQTGSQGFQTGPQEFQTGSQGFQTGPQEFQTGSQGFLTRPQEFQTGLQGFQTGPQGLEAGSQDFQTGSQGVQTGSQGFQTESQGFQTGPQGVQTDFQGFQTGSQGFQTGPQGLQTGSQGFQTGPQGVQTDFQGFQTGSQGFQTGPQGLQTGSKGFQTGFQGVQNGPADVSQPQNNQQTMDTSTGQSGAVEGRLDSRPSVDFMTTFLSTGLNNIGRRQSLDVGSFRGNPSMLSFQQLQNTNSNGKKQGMNQQEWQRLMETASGRQQAAWTSAGAGGQKVNEGQSAASVARDTRFDVDPRQLTQDKVAKNIVGTSDIRPLDQFAANFNQGQTTQSGATQGAGGQSINLDSLTMGQNVGSAADAAAATAQVNDKQNTAKTMRLLKMAKLLLRKARERLAQAGVTDQKAVAQLLGLKTVTDRLSSQVKNSFDGSSTTVGSSTSGVSGRLPAGQSLIGSGPVVGPVAPATRRDGSKAAGGVGIDIGGIEQPRKLPWFSGLTLPASSGTIDMSTSLSNQQVTDVQGQSKKQPWQTQRGLQGVSPFTGGSVHQYECTSVPDETNKMYYYQIVGSMRVRRRCALGTSFDGNTCDCSNIVKPIGDCLEVHMDFNNGRVEDISPNQLPIGNAKVEVTNGTSAYPGIAVFVGDGKLTVWRYQNYDFRDHILLKLRFRPGMGGDRRQSLISNCDGGLEEPSVGVVYDTHTRTLELLLRPVNETKSLLTFNIDANSWADVTYKYDGQTFSGTVNGVTKSNAVDGNVEITDAALVLGYCGVYGYYTGAMDDVSIYRCIP